MMWYLQALYAAITTAMWLIIFAIIWFTADDKDWGDISQGKSTPPLALQWNACAAMECLCCTAMFVPAFNASLRPLLAPAMLTSALCIPLAMGASHRAGLLFRQITTRLKDLVQRKDCAKFWRSSILVLTQEQDLPLLELCKHLTKDGLFIIGTAHCDDAAPARAIAAPPSAGVTNRRRTLTQASMLPRHRSRVAVVKAAWLWLVEQTKLNAFVSVGAGVNIIDTFRTMISSSGLGGLIPNTVVVPFRDPSRPPARQSNYVARIDDGLKAAHRRLKANKQRVLSKGGVAYCCIAPSTCNVCNHTDSQNSQLGCSSNLDYVRLLQHAIDYEKNVMIVRNSKGQ